MQPAANLWHPVEGIRHVSGLDLVPNIIGLDSGNGRAENGLHLHRKKGGDAECGRIRSRSFPHLFLVPMPSSPSVCSSSLPAPSFLPRPPPCPLAGLLHPPSPPLISLGQSAGHQCGIPSFCPQFRCSPPSVLVGICLALAHRQSAAADLSRSCRPPPLLLFFFGCSSIFLTVVWLLGLVGWSLLTDSKGWWCDF